MKSFQNLDVTMKPSGLLILLTLISSSFAFSGANSISSPSVMDEQQLNEKIKEVKNTGLKPIDENIYNICFISPMLLANAANDAISGQFVGGRWIDDLLLTSHDEYGNIVGKLIKTEGVMEIKSNPKYFDKNFQMNCRASPEEYVKDYNNVFRLKLTKEDLKNQW